METYGEHVKWVAEQYTNDPSFTYNNVESTCRQIARDFEEQWWTVMCDFERACDKVEANA